MLVVSVLLLLIMLLLILCISIRSLASKKLEEKSLPSSQRKQLTNLLSKLDVEISKQGVSDIPLKELSKQRGKDVVTRCFHKMGIVVPYDRNTELGYRPLPLTDSKSLLSVPHVSKSLFLTLGACARVTVVVVCVCVCMCYHASCYIPRNALFISSGDIC